MKNWIRLSKKEALEFFWKQTSLNNKDQLQLDDYTESDYIKYKTNCKGWNGVIGINWTSWDRIYYNPFNNSLRLYMNLGKIVFKSYRLLKIPNPIFIYNKELIVEKVRIGYDNIEPNNIFKYE